MAANDACGGFLLTHLKTFHKNLTSNITISYLASPPISIASGYEAAIFIKLPSCIYGQRVNTGTGQDSLGDFPHQPPGGLVKAAEQMACFSPYDDTVFSPSLTRRILKRTSTERVLSGISKAGIIRQLALLCETLKNKEKERKCNALPIPIHFCRKEEHLILVLSFFHSLHSAEYPSSTSDP